MSRVNPYASIEKRTFESALMLLLETEYGLLGGRRIPSTGSGQACNCWSRT